MPLCKSQVVQGPLPTCPSLVQCCTIRDPLGGLRQGSAMELYPAWPQSTMHGASPHVGSVHGSTMHRASPLMGTS